MAEQIFMSYSSADNACVERLYDQLINDRYWVWMDKKNLRGGEKWEPQIDENFKEGKNFPCALLSHIPEVGLVKARGIHGVCAQSTHYSSKP